MSREVHRNDWWGHCLLSSIEGLALFSDAVLSVFRDYIKVTRCVAIISHGAVLALKNVIID